MKFKSKLVKGIIRDRYKRFLSDIELADGEMIVAHVPNTGSMKTCWEPGQEVWLTQNDDPKRKLKYTLELTNNGETLICVNTSLTNKIAKDAIDNKMIKELNDYHQVISEQSIYDSRIDFLLKRDNLPDTYVEVKNVTLMQQKGIASFPDSVSKRGQKHLKDLIKIKQAGMRAVMLYIVNREDVNSFTPADNIDIEYGKLMRQASESGVELLAYQCKITNQEIVVHKKIEIEL